MAKSKTLVDALNALGKPRGKQLLFLQAHYEAPKRALNMRNLAKAARYKNYGGVNLQYGKLAGRIASQMGRTVPPTAVCFVADFIPPKQASNAEYILLMKPSFAQALRRAGWVR